MANSPDISQIQACLATLNPDTFPSDDQRQETLATARALCQRLEKPMESLLRLAWIEPAYAACLKVGVDIGLFAVLHDGTSGSSCSLNELAGNTGTAVDLLERVLRMLTSMGAIAQGEDGRFGPTPLSDALVSRPCSATVDYRYAISSPLFQALPSFLKARNYRAPDHLLDTAWQPALGTKHSFFDWLGQDPENLEVFTSHMAGYTTHRGTWHDVYPIRERLLNELDKPPADQQDLILVDVGGGAGHDLQRFASSFLSSENRPRLVLQDLPEVIASIDKAELPASVETQAFNFTKQPPVSGARAYYMHSVLHDWPDAAVVDILKRMHPVLSAETAAGGLPKLLLNEIVMLRQGVPPQPAALDIIMMAAFGARERSEQQWRVLLQSAGYRVNAIFTKAGIDEAILEAEAVASDVAPGVSAT